MDDNAPKFCVLLIDDEPAEKAIITRIFKALTSVPFQVDHVLKCSSAITLLQDHRYDLVLLDNRLSQRISAKFSVPLIKASNHSATMAVISNDVTPGYLQDAKELGVDYIVDKSDMIEFLKSQMDYLLSGKGRSGCQAEPA